jgi:hypothetical protein
MEDTCITEEKDISAFEIKPISKNNSLKDIFGSIFAKKKPITNSNQNVQNMFHNFSIDINESEFEKLDDFIQLEKLGSGAFSKVVKCQQKKTKKFYAMKILQKKRIFDLNQVERSKNEKMIQFEFLECPFIVNLYKTFQDDCNLYMILEYVSGGELLSWLRVNKKFSLEVFFFFFKTKDCSIYCC